MVEVDRVLAEGPAFGLCHVRMAYQVAPLARSAKIDMCSDLVGMAGFEQAASCSQIKSGPPAGRSRGVLPVH